MHTRRRFTLAGTLSLIGCLTGPLLSAAEPTAAPRRTTTLIKADHYEALKDVLVPGDVVFGFAVRDRDPSERPGTPPPKGEFRKTAWNDRKFSDSLKALEAINDPRVEKMVVLSSLADLTANVARIPRDVRWIAFNGEPGMTPGDELRNFEQVVVEFAQVCHDHGFKINFVPANFRRYEDEARLRSVAPACDAIVMQHQFELQNQGVDEFVAITKRRAALIKRFNPKCAVGVQVVLGRGSKEDAIKGLKGVTADAESCNAWTMQDTEGVKDVLRAIRE
jgi:hypothetical protein